MLPSPACSACIRSAGTPSVHPRILSYSPYGVSCFFFLSLLQCEINLSYAFQTIVLSLVKPYQESSHPGGNDVLPLMYIVAWYSKSNPYL